MPDPRSTEATGDSEPVRSTEATPDSGPVRGTESTQDLGVEDPSSKRQAIPSEQRVFSLVLALVASPQGLTKRDVLQVVYGYSDRYRPGETDTSLERQFERDKEQLRSLGIPVEALDSPLETGNNQLTRYRIDKRQLQMPADLRFTSQELSLLRLAALAWSEGSLTAESRRSVMKLEALGAGLDVQHLGIAPSIGISSPVAPALQQAITEGRNVTFEYQMPDREAPLMRHVAPLQLHRAEGRWHLIGHDLDRDAERVFLLSRIFGRVHLERGDAGETQPEVSESAKDRVSGVIEGLTSLLSEQQATVVARQGSQAETRLTGRADSERDSESRKISFGTLDYRELASEIAGFGEQVAVLDPAILRDDVIARLRAVRDQHVDGSGGEAGHGD